MVEAVVIGCTREDRANFEAHKKRTMDYNKRRDKKVQEVQSALAEVL